MAKPATKQRDDTMQWTIKAVRDVGFPIVVALMLLWQVLVAQPKEMHEFRAAIAADVDRIVQRLAAMEQSQSRQVDALMNLIMREKR